MPSPYLLKLQELVDRIVKDKVEAEVTEFKAINIPRAETPMDIEEALATETSRLGNTTPGAQRNMSASRISGTARQAGM